MVRKKKRAAVDEEAANSKHECWYCKRSFEDEHTLVTHMRAKHFKCAHCRKKLNTAGGLKIHSYSVHNTVLPRVPNAVPGRDSFDHESDVALNNADRPDDDDSASDASAAPGPSGAPAAASSSAADAADVAKKRPRLADPPGVATAAAVPMSALGAPPPVALAPPVLMNPLMNAQFQHMAAMMPLGLPPGFVPMPPTAPPPPVVVAAPTFSVDGVLTSVGTTAEAQAGANAAAGSSHLIYSDEDEQMEEKRAQLHKHAAKVAAQ
jgi:ribosomal protein L37AE/L43A